MVDFTKKLLQLGASGTNPNNLNPQLGALAPYINLMESVYPQQNLLSPEEQAFLFFTKMAEESSKPGATAIGAAGTAGQEFLKTKMAQKQLDQTRSKDILTGAVSLSAALNKPKTIKNLDIGVATYLSEADALAQYPKAKFGDFYKSITAPNDTMIGTPILNAQGNQMGIKGTYLNETLDSAFLMPLSTAASSYKASELGDIFWQYAPTIEEAKEKARKFLIESGIPSGAAGFENVINQIVTTDSNLDGQRFISGDSYKAFGVGVKNGVVESIFMKTPDKSQDPPIVKIRDERLKLLNKTLDTTRNKSRNVLPRTDGLMEALLSGNTDTGILTNLFLPFKQISRQIFGTDSAAVSAAENIQAMSFALAPLMRPVGSGSTSDMEFRAYQKAVLDLTNTPMQNYISLYVLRKSTENNEKLAEREQELWNNPKLSPEAINKTINAMDKGIFYKFPGNSEEVMAMPEGDEKIAAEKKEVQDWWDTVPQGGVAINNVPHITGKWKDYPYLIKGWKGQL
tara:strand:- start:14360 stop:15898 length:1539 start_codon:yes stop_codon:yes gene_type:complete